MAIGRPTKLNATVQAEIVKYVSTGLYFSTACQLAGIAESKGKEWLQRGNGTHVRPKTPLYESFASAVRKATQESEAVSVARIRKAAQGGATVKTRVINRKDGSTVTETDQAPPNWTADAWYLERKFPERWGRRNKVEVTGKDEGPVEFVNKTDLSKLTVEQLEELERILTAANATS